MDPVSAAVIGGVGAAVSAYGTVSAGISARNQAEYQSQVSKNNQQIALQNAEYAAEAGAARTEAAGRQARAKQGALVAGLAASGLDPNSGSAAEARESEAVTGELDQATVAHNAALETYGYKTKATGFEAESRLEENAADNAVPGALLSAGGSLLSNASRLPLGPGGSLLSNVPRLPDKYAWMAQG